MPDSPSSIIIVGSGVFGLTTALALASRPRFANTRINVFDRIEFPAPDAASIDSSRIIRADYSDPAYTKLALEAQTIWRGQAPEDIFHGIGDEGRYTESGLVLVTEDDIGVEYVRHSFQNVCQIDGPERVELLEDREAIKKVMKTGGVVGHTGYVNYRSGWADAEGAMRWVRKQSERHRNISFHTKKVVRLVCKPADDTVLGVMFDDGRQMYADLTVLAAGAWTAGLVDLRGRAVSTGQILAYLHITPEEEAKYKDMPVVLNFSNGHFMLPPRGGVLKIARHGYGYVNNQAVTSTSYPYETVEMSVPKTAVTDPGCQIPEEARKELMKGVAEMMPEFAGREFESTRLCWYTDTPTADFIVSYHATFKSLFVATGGSGHGFKFAPVLGQRIADAIDHRTPEEFKEKWWWREVEDPENVHPFKEWPWGHGMEFDTLTA